ncbi:Rv2578c family radical SAM protein [Cellulomonas shaoxiangyii]|uniref:Radical SAM protein n=1 Tax=Cellulomonas shaoxiangyii TaxID=2566013 RepID=A0A4P7SI12_9CELL|nr:Rv2578c family radical SAM protein [Cellulomonas shaoxiangyii]QCB93660.1 radical SAM protein [Cellulomonas shaoxiangyii]TGY86141.1 radical SAM protein [Cellulomonas shaoxiangyii]
MRWDGQKVGAASDGVLPGMDLRLLPGLVRSVRTPDFAGVTFHEVLCRSALNRVPEASSVPFRWTVNPMRGCLHACAYCFARPTHEYLDLGAGRDFENQIVVKTNVVEVLRAELGRATWRREHVALGTNTDPYQRAEGRYRLMPGILEALASTGTPLSVLTKGTLLRRDLPLLADVAAGGGSVAVSISLATVDDELQRVLEPGTPTPRARLELIRAVRDAGLTCGVLVAPVLPWLTDSEEHLDALLGALAEAGATGVSVMALHLRGAVKPLMEDWLRAHRPGLLARYRRLYGGSAYTSDEYRHWLDARVAPLLTRHGFADPREHRAWRAAGTPWPAASGGPSSPEGAPEPAPAVPTLF